MLAAAPAEQLGRVDWKTAPPVPPDVFSLQDVGASRIELRQAAHDYPGQLAELQENPLVQVRYGSADDLVGSNGAGKSNFVEHCASRPKRSRFSLDHALRERGGINEVRWRSRGHPKHFGIRLEFRLPESVRLVRV